MLGTIIAIRFLQIALSASTLGNQLKFIFWFFLNEVTTSITDTLAAWQQHFIDFYMKATAHGQEFIINFINFFIELYNRLVGHSLIPDLVTEMREIKHPFRAGLKAQPGIDY